MPQKNISDFLELDIHSWTIIQVEDFPEARNPAYKIWVDFWETLWVKKTSSQVTNYNKKELVGKQILGVTNLEPKQVWKFMSEFLLTAFVDKKGTAILAVPDTKVENGMKLL